MRDVGVDPFDSKMNSMSHRGSPVQAHIECAIVTREVASGSKSRGDTTTLEDQGVLERLAQTFAQDE